MQLASLNLQSSSIFHCSGFEPYFACDRLDNLSEEKCDIDKLSKAQAPANLWATNVCHLHAAMHVQKHLNNALYQITAVCFEHEYEHELVITEYPAGLCIIWDNSKGLQDSFILYN